MKTNHFKSSIRAIFFGFAFLSVAHLDKAFAQEANPVVTGDPEFAKQQIDLVNTERQHRIDSGKSEVCDDQFLTAASFYYDWIANYQSQLTRLNKAYQDAAYLIDSFILSNTNIDGFTYQKQANAAAVNLTYADFREYLKWTHSYASTSPNLEALKTNLGYAVNNKWGLTLDKARLIVVQLGQQLNQCDGSECIHIALTMDVDAKRGIVLQLSFPVKEFGTLAKEHLMTASQLDYTQMHRSLNGNLETFDLNELKYDLTEFIEQQKPFEEVLKTALGDLNPSYAKVAYGEPSRWNYFASTFIASACGEYGANAAGDPSKMYSFPYLSYRGIDLVPGAFGFNNSQWTFRTFEHVFGQRDWKMSIGSDPSYSFACTVPSANALTCSREDYQVVDQNTIKMVGENATPLPAKNVWTLLRKTAPTAAK